MAETTKLQVMTLGNLQKYDGLIKNYIDVACAEVDEKSLKTVALVNGKLCFYNVEEPVGATTPVFEITLPKEDLTGLMSKLPSNAVENNIVVVGTNGEVKDSGIAVSDVAIKSEVAQTISTLEGKVNANTDKVTALVGDDANKSVRAIAAEELAAQLVPENAKESLDTLTEISAWIQSHPDDASAMNKAIEDLEKYVGTIPEGATATDVVGYIDEVKAALTSAIGTAKAEAIEAAAGDATTKANAAEKNAKDYADAEFVKDRARLDGAEADIAALEESLATGGATANAIAEAKKAGTDAQTTANEAKELATTNAGAITDLTGRVAKNEEDIEGLQGELTTVSGSLNGVTDRVTQAEKDIDALETKVATLEQSGYDDSELRELIQTNTTDITNIKAEQTTQNGKIAANEGAINALKDRATAVEGEVDTLQSEMDAVEKKADDNATAIGGLQTTVNAHGDRLTELEARVQVEAIPDASIEALFAQA